MICKLLCPHAGQLLVATLRWDVFDWKRDIVQLEQEKGGKALVLPITPMLRDALKPLPRTRAIQCW